MTDESFQVSPQQEQLWLETPEGPSGRIQAVVSLSGPIDPAAVPRALDSVVARHEILRTTFVRHPGIRVPLQVVRDELPPVWETVDLTAQPAAQQDDRIALLAARELRAPIDFASASPVRAVLIARADARQTLILTLSSLSADAASAALLVAELAHHLNGAGTLTDEPLQYADFAAWQRELHASDDAEALAARQFWQGLDDDAGRTGPALPFARSTTVAPIACEPVPVALDGPLAANLSTTAAEHGATLEALAHAAWCTVLARSAGAEEATVAFVGTERRHADLDGAIGALSRSVPLSTGELAGITFPELLQGLTRARADSLVWQDYAPADGRAGFATGFVAAAGASVRAGGTSVELERVLDTGRGFALALTCTTGDGEPRLELCFDPECHDRESVERLGRRLERTSELRSGHQLGLRQRLGFGR